MKSKKIGVDFDIVSKRLAELLGMKSGWMNGEGEEFSKQFLDWFLESMKKWYNPNLPMPYIFPTIYGGLSLEWDIEGITLEIEKDKTGELVISDNSIIDSVEKLDMSTDRGWEILNSALGCCSNK